MTARTRIASVAAAIVLIAVPPAFAQLAGRSADEWMRTLDTADRINSLKLGELLPALKLKPGMVVADIGAGTGLISLPMARAVKPGGSVYAVDIVKELVDHVGERATEEGLVNVVGVLGTPDDPNMPDNVDLALICDTLHHIEQRAEYLKQLAQYLKPGGRVAVVEFNPDKSPHRSDPSLVVSEEQTTAWMAAAGLKVVDQVKIYDDKWFVIYGL